MFTQIIMVLALNLLPLLFSPAFVRSDQSMLPLKSFKIRENVTYDCIDIYKQPGLDHPLLKNHKIQMKPSFSIHETSINVTYKEKTGCPYGTVPILRNTKEYITQAQLFSEKNVHPLSKSAPGAHVAGVRSRLGLYHGVRALTSGYKLNIGKDQYSSNRIFIYTRSVNILNFIQVGFMINPNVFGDTEVWSYGYWKGKDGKGCINTACPGFIQISEDIPISQPFHLKADPQSHVSLVYSIHHDPKSGNWWLTQDSKEQPYFIGYWPNELFNLFIEGANMVGVEGVVKASNSGSSPPMGNGHFPSRDLAAATFSSIEAVGPSYEFSRMDSFPIVKMEDSPNCYEVMFDTVVRPPLEGYYFYYGGPGGNSCGV